LTTHISVTVQPILTKLEIENYHPKATNHATLLYLDPTTWVVWANTQFALLGFFFVFFGFLVTRTGRTSGPILTIPHTTSVLIGNVRGCGDAFTALYTRHFGGVALILLPSYRRSNPPSPNFGGINRHFPTERMKYSNFHITKTTEWIPTKFCPVIKTSTYSLWVVPKCAPWHKSKIEDGRHCHQIRRNLAQLCIWALDAISAIKISRN